MYKRRKSRIAAEAKDVFNMQTSIKEIDKVYKSLNDAVMILRKFEAALQANKIKQKVNDETGVDIDTLIEQADKIADKVTSYSIKLSVIKEK
jgi:hypothetical protein